MAEEKPVTFDRNTDGSVIVKLAKPITLHGEQVDRATIPALRGKHMRICPFGADDGASVPMSKLVEFAALVVVPAGFVDELGPMEALAVAAEVATSVGKAR